MRSRVLPLLVAAVITALALPLSGAGPVVAAGPAAGPAGAPRYQWLGNWAHIDVVYRYGTDETITFGADDYWAQQTRIAVVNSGLFGVRCLYPNLSGDPALDCNNDPSQGPVSRPGLIACAFIQRYTGYWQLLQDYSSASIGVGQSLIAIRDDGSTTYTGADCAAVFSWAAGQDDANGFGPPVPTVGGGGGGCGGGCGGVGPGGGGGVIAPPAHRAQRPRTARCRRRSPC